MESGWIILNTYSTQVEAEIDKSMLIENNLPAVVMNRQDVFVRFGKIELYVREEDLTRAKQMIEKSQTD